MRKALAILRPLARITSPNKTLDFPSEKAELDLRKTSQPPGVASTESETVFSDGGDAIASSTAEKQAMIGDGTSGVAGILRKSSERRGGEAVASSTSLEAFAAGKDGFCGGGILVRGLNSTYAKSHTPTPNLPSCKPFFLSQRSYRLCFLRRKQFSLGEIWCGGVRFCVSRVKPTPNPYSCSPRNAPDCAQLVEAMREKPVQTIPQSPHRTPLPALASRVVRIWSILKHTVSHTKPRFTHSQVWYSNRLGRAFFRTFHMAYYYYY
jgi:hypothetical protein